MSDPPITKDYNPNFTWKGTVVIKQDQMSVTENELSKIDKLIEAEKKYNSLRLAVLEFINGLSKYEHDGRDEMYVHFNDHKDLALSAGIEFVNGTWILKEGEK